VTEYIRDCNSRVQSQVIGTGFLQACYWFLSRPRPADPRRLPGASASSHKRTLHPRRNPAMPSKHAWLWHGLGRGRNDRDGRWKGRQEE